MAGLLFILIFVVLGLAHAKQVLYLSSLHRVFFIVDGWGWVVGGTGV
jgi:hypothetical protein